MKTICPAVGWGEWRDPNGWNPSLDQYLQELKLLSKDCNFRQVSAIQHREEAIRDAFISGLLSGSFDNAYWKTNSI